jgi:hypothetical protein
MKHEERRVEPLLRGLTARGVHEFVFRDEQAGKCRQEHVPRKVVGVRRQRQREAVAAEHARRVQRMTDALPTRQAAASMKVQLVYQHG